MAIPNLRDYWRLRIAPQLLARKKELGRGVPEREIAAAVEAATGLPSNRSLVWMWLHGEREPGVAQFIALCRKLDVDPALILGLSASSKLPNDTLPPGVTMHGRGSKKALSFEKRIATRKDKKMA